MQFLIVYRITDMVNFIAKSILKYQNQIDSGDQTGYDFVHGCI